MRLSVIRYRCRFRRRFFAHRGAVRAVARHDDYGVRHRWLDIDAPAVRAPVPGQFVQPCWSHRDEHAAAAPMSVGGAARRGRGV
jgi:hypothetical protein